MAEAAAAAARADYDTALGTWVELAHAGVARQAERRCFVDGLVCRATSPRLDLAHARRWPATRSANVCSATAFQRRDRRP